MIERDSWIGAGRRGIDDPTTVCKDKINPKVSHRSGRFLFLQPEEEMGVVVTAQIYG